MNLGYAQIARLPVTAGLYALVVPTLLRVIPMAMPVVLLVVKGAAPTLR